MMLDFDRALHRAARRTPTRAARASLQAIRTHLERLAAAPLPEPAPMSGPLRIIPGEYWCLECGNAGIPAASTEVTAPGATRRSHCYTCGSTRLVAATEVLRSGEYCEIGGTDGNKLLPSVLAADNEATEGENHG